MASERSWRAAGDRQFVSVIGEAELNYRFLARSRTSPVFPTAELSRDPVCSASDKVFFSPDVPRIFSDSLSSKRNGCSRGNNAAAICVS